MIERIIISGYRCFESLDFEPNQGLNIVVGDNESGKSTLLEAISLVLTGRSNGRWLGEELNPYWFHRPNVTSFFQGSPTPALAPEFFIELYFSDSHDPLQAMRGVNNSLKEDVPGVLVKAAHHFEPSAQCQLPADHDPQENRVFRQLCASTKSNRASRPSPISPIRMSSSRRKIGSRALPGSPGK